MNQYTNDHCFIVAEIGLNHNGSVKTARDMFRSAKQCGADAVKLQVFTGDDFYWKDKKFPFGKSKQWHESVPELFKKRQLSKDEIAELYNYAKEIGIVCFSTPLAFQWLAVLIEIDNPIYKISSGDITCLPFIEEIARIGKPIILSTGKSKLSDVDCAIEAIRKHTTQRLGILHCVAAYPTPLQEANLRLIQTFKTIYDCIPGFSDHTEGILASMTAVAMGARIIEKHFTLDKADYGPDHWFSVDPTELKQLVFSIRSVESMLGDGHKRLLQIEADSYIWGTRCIVVKRNMKKGEMIQIADLDFKRPCFGIRADHIDLVIGKTIRNDLSENQAIKITDLE